MAEELFKVSMEFKKTVITCAVTGSATKPDQTPHLPITPQQIADSALEAADAGAAVVHIHVRNVENGRPSMSFELYKDVFDRIKAKNKDVLINLTTGPGAHFVPSQEDPSQPGPGTRMCLADERVKHIEILKPDICSLDLNTMHLGGPAVRINRISISREMLKRIQAVGTKPELELFDSGDLRIALELIADGTIEQPALWQFAMGIKYGWDATPAVMQYAYSQLPPNPIWSAFGISRQQMPMVALTWMYGGHVRVGMEDNIYLQRGVLAESNAQLVKKAVNIITEIGGEVANPAEARVLLGLKR